MVHEVHVGIWLVLYAYSFLMYVYYIVLQYVLLLLNCNESLLLLDAFASVR